MNFASGSLKVLYAGAPGSKLTISDILRGNKLEVAARLALWVRGFKTGIGIRMYKASRSHVFA